MANAIKNFHFCFVDTSLSKDIKWCIWKKTGAEVPQMSAIYFFRFTEPNNRIMARIFLVKYFLTQLRAVQSQNEDYVVISRVTHLGSACLPV